MFKGGIIMKKKKGLNTRQWDLYNYLKENYIEQANLKTKISQNFGSFSFIFYP